jgi:hypothetical protein
MDKSYLAEAKARVSLAFNGLLPRRPLGRKVYVPGLNYKIAQRPAHFGLTTQSAPSLEMFEFDSSAND